MNVSEPFIRRPIATTLLAIAATLTGALGYLWMPVASLPQVDFPTILVSTQFPGANPETTARLVTAPLERQLGQIPALDSMTSTSSFGVSRITLQFRLDRDIDAAAQDVQSAIAAAGSTLPRSLPYPPVYAKVNPADAPILTLALTSSTVPLHQLSDLADTMIAQRLASVPGVGRVAVEGGIKPAVRVRADLARLAGYGLGMADLRAAVVAANVTGPKGTLDGAFQSYAIAANDQIDDPEAYRSVIVAYRNGAPVLLDDVAEVVRGLENERIGGWYQGDPAVIIDVSRQPGANVIDAVQRVRAELPRLQRAIPVAASLAVVHDRTGTIRASVNDVEFTLCLSVALVVAVVLLFLRSARATVIAGVALPVSLVATFAVMWLVGFQIDNLSLMALTIGTGFVVDDAIVMIENIVRRIEQGERPFEAALAGARQIGFTVISLTLSLVAVFIPLLFMTGLVGRMFREFALTQTIAVVISAVVSLTLTPMMCARLLRPVPETGPGRVAAACDAAVDGVVALYRRTLDVVLRHETVTLVATAGTLVLTVALYAAMPKGFLPQQDTGLVTGVLEAAPDASFAEMVRLQDRVGEALRADPDVTALVSVLGVGALNPTPNVGHLKIVLRPRQERTAGVDAVIARLADRAGGVPGASVQFRSVQDVQIGTRISRALYQYTLVGADADQVAHWSARLVERLKASPVLAAVASDAQDGGLRAVVRVDRETAGRLGVSMQGVNDALNDAFGQRQISTIYAQTNQYRVVLEAMPEFRDDVSALSRIYVPGAGGVQVPLASVARVERGTAPLTVAHVDQFPSVTISFDLARGAALGDAVREIADAQRDIGMPSSVAGEYSGDADEFARSLAGQPWLILAAVLAIYIVLGVLYESVVHPFTILTTLPSAGIGALLALRLAGMDLSLIGLIGIVLLMGIVKKNAIMMIDFAIEAERVRGLTPREAILEACMLRFRPIMMTTLAALFGALPLALENGAGCELRNPLGVSIVGGLLLSQLLTLYTTPVIYLAMERLRRTLTPRTAGAAGSPAE